jgi:pimeloyl-ACP methyl ester carboxylesterase
VCTYDRAGDGLSDARPASVRPLTGATQARELHALLAVIHSGPPYVLVGHSYGGMITREFAALYPGQVAGVVLLDASSELKTVLEREARAQRRLALLSADSIHGLDRGIGHLVPSLDPQIVIAASKAVLATAASGHSLAPCPQDFRPVPAAECLHRGQLGHQRT